jgi:hypothetical protein
MDDYRKIIKNIIHSYGQTATRQNGEALRAFLQPLRFKNRVNLGGLSRPLGYDDNRHYLCLYSPDESLSLNERLVFDDGVCVVIRSETVYAEQNPLYRWAILKKGSAV